MGELVVGFRFLAASLALSVSAPANALPFHDSIPKEFWGTFAPSLPDCKAQYGTELAYVSADRIHYYEGDDYLIIGVAFSGASTKSGKSVPLFNGRFTGRMEDKLLGEINVRMEMETPNLLIRYVLRDDGEPDSKPSNTWVRCPAANK